ncbi:MAG: hypothetical protein ABJH07_19955 [Sedimentitalea sp.]|uniref:VPLPA-CTERM sorting domain-containing protein n=1 Tax=Sedimentitalea sp. TaxID=2048915 RepID=UPI00329A5AC7
MRKSKFLLKSSILVLALGVIPLPAAAVTMQAVFTGHVRFITDGEPLGLDSNVPNTTSAESGNSSDRVSYTAKYIYDTDLATTLGELDTDFEPMLASSPNTAFVPILSSSLTINGHTFELGTGQATYMPYFTGGDENIWAQYNTSIETVDQESRFSGSMGQRAFFHLPDPEFDYAAATSDPENSELAPDFGYEFFTDQFRRRIFASERQFSLAERDLDTGETIWRTSGLLFHETMQVSAVPLPASLPVLFCAIGTLTLLRRRKRALP